MKWEPAENIDGYSRLLVEAAWDEIESDYNDIVDEYSDVRLPGFRPGKVSRTVIEQRFRKEIIEDLSQRAAERLGREAIREAGLETLGPVEATDIECEKCKPFRFNARYHPMPKIDLPDLDSLKIANSGADPLDQISLRLLELVSFDIPEVMLKDELALDGIEKGAPGSTEWKAARDRIKLMLILKQIAQQEGIEVDETDVAQRIKEKAVDFNSNPDTLRAELEKEEGLQRLRDMLLAESTLAYLIEKARGT
jgi:FKBP-type peptidyl-prolyl cis-trans isomerase (trigger factor)